MVLSGQFESALQASERVVSKLIGYSNMETDIKVGRRKSGWEKEFARAKYLIAALYYHDNFW